MKIKLIIKSSIVIAIIIGIIYLKIVKIPILCFGCEEEGEWTRCMEDTGAGTTTCDIYNEVQDKFDEAKKVFKNVKNTFVDVGEAIMVPIRAIESGIDALIDVFDTVASGIPSIPEFEIPQMPAFSCGIDLKGIPGFDPCIALNEVVNNAFILPINTFIDGMESAVNGTISGINSAVGWTGGSIDEVSIDRINDINLTCNVDFGQLISDAIGTSTIDICNGITIAINDGVIYGLNKALEGIRIGLNIAIEGINTGVKIVVEGIKTAIVSIINTLIDQLKALNIFRDLIGQFGGLVSGFKLGDIARIIYVYILPFFNAIIPGISLTDVALILILLALIPIIMPILIVLFLLIDLIFP